MGALSGRNCGIHRAQCHPHRILAFIRSPLSLRVGEARGAVLQVMLENLWGWGLLGPRGLARPCCLCWAVMVGPHPPEKS